MRRRQTEPNLVHGNPRVREEHSDPYHVRAKLREPARCNQCGAVYHKGRWQWLEDVPADARDLRCSACQRIEDNNAAGEIVITGAFATEHADEVLNLVRNMEKAENREHPLNRIMDVQQKDGVLTVTTTDIHLPRRIGHALEDAWDGDLDTHYDGERWFIRVTWRRD